MSQPLKAAKSCCDKAALLLGSVEVSFGQIRGEQVDLSGDLVSGKSSLAVQYNDAQQTSVQEILSMSP